MGGTPGLPDASAVRSGRVKGLCMDSVWKGRGKKKAADEQTIFSQETV